MSRWQSAWRLIPLMALLTFVLSGCGLENLTALDPKGPVAEKQLSVIYISLIVMIGVFAIVMIIYVYVLMRFRKRKGQTGVPKQVEGNHKLEIIWTVIPFLLLIVIAIPTVKYTFELDKDYSKDPNALQVKVTGHQFWWEFEYMNEKVTTAQDLIIPTGRTIAFHLESADVIHSFWVPTLGGKKDTNPGMTNMHYLKADKPGTYYGKCAELCGDSHALMDFKVKAVSPDEFDRWVASMKTPTSLPVAAQIQDGEKIFKDKCLACHAIYNTQSKQVEGGKVGPNLVNYADRSTVAGILFNREPGDLKNNLKTWLQDPQAVKPGNLMPNPKKVEGSKMDQDLGLNDQQISALVEYLAAQKQK
ncbi:cytochrome c oxidase subunit II [Paenibacillus ginsengarvi]|uniref:Cytochrome c oxidase subunit 2 n=1 Tax=Paenibacillus ginsengarvi TaxID=400777 RepID=A0A3B0AKF9_9BACL|nr:cytochrome c oxidase subunit II [Paenibacillus ginsengarvi]RKN61395.1 cytochrome c oxidase subunit II [Paenibacillus ginsengarvi]